MLSLDHVVFIKIDKDIQDDIMVYNKSKDLLKKYDTIHSSDFLTPEFIEIKLNKNITFINVIDRDRGITVENWIPYINGEQESTRIKMKVKTNSDESRLEEYPFEFLILETYDLVNVLSDMRFELKESNFIYIAKSDETRADGIDIRIESRC